MPLKCAFFNQTGQKLHFTCVKQELLKQPDASLMGMLQRRLCSGINPSLVFESDTFLSATLQTGCGSA